MVKERKKVLTGPEHFPIIVVFLYVKLFEFRVKMYFGSLKS